MNVRTYLRHERCETANRVDDGSASSFKTRERDPQPSCPYDHGDTKKTESNSRNNLREEPNFLLHGCQLEFRVAGHGNDATHDGSITSGEYDPGAFSKVELRARLRVSIALSEVDVTVPGIISLLLKNENGALKINTEQ